MGLYDRQDNLFVYGGGYLLESDELEPVSRYFKPYLEAGECFTDLEPANACVRVIMKVQEGYFIDHLRVTTDVSSYWHHVVRTRSLHGANVLISGGNDYSNDSRRLVAMVEAAIDAAPGITLIGRDLMGDVDRRAYVYKDRVVITREHFSTKQLMEPLIYEFTNSSIS